MRIARALLVCTLLVAAGCGSSSKRTKPAPAGSTATVTPAPAPATTQAGGTTASSAPTGRAATTSVRVYFLRQGKLIAVGRPVSPTAAVPRTAFELLLKGPTPAEANTGLTSALSPRNRLQRLAVADGVAALDTTVRVRPGPELAQIVYTLTQFPAVKRVSVVLETNDSADYARGDFESLTPPILIESPLPGDVVKSPVHITGTSNTFEATFYVDLVQGTQAIVKQHLVTASSGSGTRGTFDVSIPYTVPREGLGQIVAYEISAADGKRTHVAEVTVVFSP